MLLRWSGSSHSVDDICKPLEVLSSAPACGLSGLSQARMGDSGDLGLPSASRCRSLSVRECQWQQPGEVCMLFRGVKLLLACAVLMFPTSLPQISSHRGRCCWQGLQRVGLQQCAQVQAFKRTGRVRGTRREQECCCWNRNVVAGRLWKGGSKRLRLVYSLGDVSEDGCH